MSEPEAKYTIKRLPTFTLIVTMDVSKELRFRFWLAKRLIRLAGRLMNANIEFSTMSEYAPEAANGDVPPSWMR
jgi:hypothetical protein